MFILLYSYLTSLAVKKMIIKLSQLRLISSFKITKAPNYKKEQKV